MILLGFGLVLLTGSAVAAFAWAAGAGQFENLEAAPDVIFDSGEPAGRASDCFPDPTSRAAMKWENHRGRGGPVENAAGETDVRAESGEVKDGF